MLRSSLSLAAALGRPVRIERIRAGRPKSGVLRQHRTAALAAAEVCGGEVRGAELGSDAIELVPRAVKAGAYRFAVGSAGSAMLVLQTVVPPLMLADGESRVEIEGGTHNPWAPPFEAVQRSFARALRGTGFELELALERPGFYPAGGGSISARIRPADAPQAVALLERGPERSRTAEVLLAHLPRGVGERELACLRRRLPAIGADASIRELATSAGPGNVVHVTLEYDNVTEVFTGFGERNVSAEVVARRVSDAVRRYIAQDAPVGEHLADQLMLPLALLAGGTFRATVLSKHARTNAQVINAFLPGSVALDSVGRGGIVRVGARGA